MCHRINSSILSRTGREGCYTLMLIYSNEELQEKKKQNRGKPGQIKGANQDPRHTAEPWGKEPKFPHLLFCLLLTLSDKPEGFFDASLSNYVFLFASPIQLCQAMRTDQGWTFVKECAWMGRNEGINNSLEGQELVFGKGSTRGWCSWKPGKMLAHRVRAAYKKNEPERWGQASLGSRLNLGSLPRRLDTALLQQWIRNEAEMIHKGWKIHHWHPRS